MAKVSWQNASIEIFFGRYQTDSKAFTRLLKKYYQGASSVSLSRWQTLKVIILLVLSSTDQPPNSPALLWSWLWKAEGSRTGTLDAAPSCQRRAKSCKYTQGSFRHLAHLAAPIARVVLATSQLRREFHHQARQSRVTA